MRRPVWYRALTAIWALWFAVALIEPAGIHQCPVHGAAGADMAGMGAMAGMANMDMAGMSMAHDQTPPGHQSQHPLHCCCLSTGCSAPAFVPSAPSGELADRIVARSHEPSFADVPSPLIDRAHALPFANGPPASV
ncbi:MAG TPA: hypothetical protein VHB25_21870 [Gemmatimonadaceae bacterium]|nr:hypothetical protein [Gemmatimonadaceae bacterium]